MVKTQTGKLDCWTGGALRVALCLALVGATARARADSSESQETWTGGGVAGWTNDTADLTLSNPGGYLDIKFKLQGVPMPVEGKVWVEVPAGVLLTNLTFQFRAATICPSALRVVLQAANGHLWQNRVTCVDPGTWQTLNAPVNYRAGWSIGPMGSAQDFERDLRHITRMGVYIIRHGVPDEQHYALDDFMLQGLALSALDVDGDGMRDAWEQANRLDPDDPTDAATDADEDGMSNYAEYVAGSNPQDPSSRFVVEVAVKSGDGAPVEGIVLRWNSTSNRTYAIWRTLDLRSAGLPLDAGLPATPPQNEYVDPSATNLDAGYYFIDVQSTE